MDESTIEQFGRVAGLGGLVVGMFYMLWRLVIQRGIFPTLTKAQAHDLLMLLLLATFLLVLAGIGGWLLHDMISATSTTK